MALCILLVAGCKSYDRRVAEARDAYFAGDYLRSSEKFEELARNEPENGHLLGLEQALPLLALGRFEESERFLSIARDRLDEFKSGSGKEFVQAALTDDEGIAYTGEDYERIFVRALLAVVNLMRGGGDAIAFANQVDDEQERVLQVIRAEGGDPGAGQRVAFGAYLAATLFEDRVRFDRAARLYEQAAEWAPQLTAAQLGARRARGEDPPLARGHGVVHVIALVGTGPRKVEVDEPVSSTALVLAQAVYRIGAERTVLPSMAPVKIPAVVETRCPVDAVRVFGERGLLGTSEVAADVATMARSQFEAKKDWIVARAVLRRVLKLAIVEAGTHVAARQDNSTAGFGVDILATLLSWLWTGTETADTRCWSCLPATLQVLRLELPAGEHALEIVPSRGGRELDTGTKVVVSVRDGYATYVLAVASGTFPPAVQIEGGAPSPRDGSTLPDPSPASP